MAIYYGHTGKAYNLSTQFIGGGGEGTIIEVVGMQDYVAKIYHEKQRTSFKKEKIFAMMNNPPAPSEIGQFAWPTEILFENNKFVGFMMPWVQNIKKLNEMYANDKRAGYTWDTYIGIALNLSAAINSVHKIGHVCGDLNPNNVCVNIKNTLITLVDTDSYHIFDKINNRIYRCEVGTAEFVPRELQGVNFASALLPTYTQESDLFSLAVLIFSLLMNGSHPFACSISQSVSSRTSFQPIDNISRGFSPFVKNVAGVSIPKYAPPINILPDDLIQLFKRAFIDGHSNPKDRPKASEWFFTLEKLHSSIKVCKSDSSHKYYDKLSACPWCEVEKRMQNINMSNVKSQNNIIKQSMHQVQGSYQIGSNYGSGYPGSTGVANVGTIPNTSTQVANSTVSQSSLANTSSTNNVGGNSTVAPSSWNGIKFSRIIFTSIFLTVGLLLVMLLAIQLFKENGLVMSSLNNWTELLYNQYEYKAWLIILLPIYSFLVLVRTVFRKSKFNIAIATILLMVCLVTGLPSIINYTTPLIGKSRSVSSNSPASVQDIYVVNVSYANTRSEPRKKSKVVGTYANGTELIYLNETKTDSSGINWMKITTPDKQTAWISSNLVKKK